MKQYRYAGETIEGANTVMLLNAATEKAKADAMKVLTMKTLLCAVADCGQHENWQGIKNLLPAILKATE